MVLADQVPERAFQSHILMACRLHGLLAYHTHDSRRSQRGFPDLVIVGPRGVLFRELKTTKGRVSTEQQQWLDALTVAGQDAAVWRPGPAEWERIERELRAIR